MASDILRSLIVRVLDGAGEHLYKTSIVKLVYLIDHRCFRHRGRTLSGLEYKWDHYGPNAAGNEINLELGLMEEEGLVIGKPAYGGDTGRVYRSTGRGKPHFSAVEDAIIDDVIRQYGKMSVEDLKQASKGTEPFKHERPGRKLRMQRAERPTPTIEPSDWERHLAEKEAGESVTISEIRAKYAVD